MHFSLAAVAQTLPSFPPELLRDKVADTSPGLARAVTREHPKKDVSHPWKL